MEDSKAKIRFLTCPAEPVTVDLPDPLLAPATKADLAALLAHGKTAQPVKVEESIEKVFAGDDDGWST